MLGELGVGVDEAAYVDDAVVDVQVARRAGVRAIGVSWGYDSTNPLPVEELNAYIHSPIDLLELLEADMQTIYRSSNQAQ